MGSLNAGSGIAIVLRGIGLALLVLLGSAGAASADDALPSTDPILVTETVEPTVQTVEPVTDQAAGLLQPVVEDVEPVVEPIVDLVEPVTDVVVSVIDPSVEVVQPVIDPVAGLATPELLPAADVTSVSPSRWAHPITDGLAAGWAGEQWLAEESRRPAPVVPGGPLPDRTPSGLPPPGVWAGVSLMGGATMALLGAGLLAMLLGARWRLWSLALTPRGRSLLPVVPPA